MSKKKTKDMEETDLIENENKNLIMLKIEKFKSSIFYFT